MKQTVSFIIFLIGFQIFSQSYLSNTRFIHLTKTEGLSQNSILTIEKDELGFMWIGTKNGLNKFDGERITVYTTKKGDSTSLSNNYISALEADDEGFLWIGTKNGINRYNPFLNSMERFNKFKHTNLEKRTITAVHKLQNGDIWFGSHSGLIIYSKKQDSILDLKGDHEFLKSRAVSKIFQDVEGKIWVGTSTGLYVITDQQGKLSYFEMKLNSHVDKKIDVRAITADIDGKIWVGTKNLGLLHYNTSEKVLQRVKNPQMQDLDIRDIEFDTHNNLWIAAFKGLYIFNKDRTVSKIDYKNNYGDIIADGLNEIYLDDYESIWMGGAFGGLKIWNTMFNSFNQLKTLRPEADIDLGLVNAIVEDLYGNIYFGTKKNGILVFDQNFILNKKASLALEKKFSEITVKSMLIDKNLLWITTLEIGVQIYDYEKQIFVTDLLSKELTDILNDTKVYHIAKTDEKIVFGTFDKGMVLYDLTTKEISQLPKSTKIGDQILGLVRIIYFDTKKNLWIGSNKGLRFISAQNLKQKITSAEKIDLIDSQQVTDMEVLAIAEDSDNQIWVGTTRNMLFAIRDRKVRKIDFSGISMNSGQVSNIVVDKQNQLWLSSDKGVIHYNTENNNALLFNENYGLTNMEFRNQSSLKSEEGNIYFGSSIGAIFFDPKNIHHLDTTNPVIITDFIVYNKEKDTGIYYPSLETIKEKKHKLLLSHSQNSFTINFSSLDYTKILNNSYEYRLLGLNDDWTLTTTPGIKYTLQKPGKYLFEVRNGNTSKKNKKEAITSLEINLEPAPWRSWYAVICYVLIVFGLLFGAFRFIQSKTRLKHQLALESLEKRKEQEKYRYKIEFFTNLSHDFRTPLTLMLAPIHQLIEKYEGSSKVYKKLISVKRNAEQLLHLVNQLLEFEKIDSNKDKLIIENRNLIDFVKGIHSSFEEFARLGNYTYKFISESQHLSLFFDPDKLERVFYNLISNAFKNTPKGGHIEILIEEEKQNVLIRIKDDGQGIDPGSIENLFDRFVKDDQGKAKNIGLIKGTGIGLHIVKTIIDLHKGSITVESLKGKGSVFTVVLQKGQNHLTAYAFKKSSENENSKNVYEKLSSDQLSNYDAKLDVENLSHKQIDGKPTILIIEDNRELRAVLVDLFAKEFNIEQAKDGKDALSKAFRKKIDLIISDIMIPKLNGMELCKKLKTDDRTQHVPIILLTSRSSKKQRMEGLESGADAYLVKPFVPKELYLVTNNLLYTTKAPKQKLNTPGEISSSNTQTISVEEKLYNQAMQIVLQNLGNTSFEINSFSKELGISRTKLYKKIRDWTNQSPKEFIQTVRLNKAAQLLELGDMSISDVCYEVGFASTTYFATCFKKQFGKTPSEYADTFYPD